MGPPRRLCTSVLWWNVPRILRTKIAFPEDLFELLHGIVIRELLVCVLFFPAVTFKRNVEDQRLPVRTLPREEHCVLVLREADAHHSPVGGKQVDLRCGYGLMQIVGRVIPIPY